MPRIPLAAQRSLVTVGLVVFLALMAVWVWSPGLPVLWGPSASAAEVAAGRELFEHEWTPNDPLAHGDGLGPVFNARSCAACHFQGGVGGGGELAHNAVGFEVLPRPGDPRFLTGTVHSFSVNPTHKETAAALRAKYPPFRQGPAGQFDRDSDPVRTQSIQTTALYGAGWIDLISDKAIAHNFRSRSVSGAIREAGADFSSVPVGRLRTLPGGRVGKFGWRAQMATLAEFVANACANEIGLGTPTARQPAPFTASASASAVPPDLDEDQFDALVAFVKTLPRPVEATPTNPGQREAAAEGKRLFAEVGCATCHVPDVGGVRGVYSDFLLYTLDDPAPAGGRGGYGPEPPPDLPRPDDEPPPSEWKTAPLWGVADSPPYFHDGASATLRDAILRHKGDARTVTDRFTALDREKQNAVVAFLRMLKAPPDAPPLRNPAVTQLVRR